jgi:hypothetical protein
MTETASDRPRTIASGNSSTDDAAKRPNAMKINAPGGSEKLR